MKDRGEMVIYQTEDGITRIDVKIEDETVWRTQQRMQNCSTQRHKTSLAYEEHV